MNRTELIDNIRASAGISVLELYAEQINRKETECEFSSLDALLFKAAIILRRAQLTFAEEIAARVKTADPATLGRILHFASDSVSNGAISISDYEGLLHLAKRRPE